MKFTMKTYLILNMLHNLSKTKNITSAIMIKMKRVANCIRSKQVKKKFSINFSKLGK